MPSNNNSVEQKADYLAKFVMILASFGLVMMTAVTSWQVIGRYVLNSSPSWSEPFALIAMLYVVLFGAAVGVHEGFHLSVRLFVNGLSLRCKKTVFILGQILVAVFGIAMAWNGVALANFTSEHVIPALGISRSVAYWPFAICGALIAVFALVRCAAVVRSDGAFDPWS